MTNTMTLQNTPTKTMQVTGTGNLKVSPDTTRIRMTLEEVEKDYGATLERSSQQTAKLREMFQELGFRKEDLKTRYFNVSTKYEGYRDKNNDWKQRFVGYEYTHTLVVEFPMDNALLGKILYALANGQVPVEFHIEYTIADPSAAKNQLLAKAVADSRAKAEVLAMAGGVTLQQVLKIDYSWGEVELVSRPVNDMVLMNKCATPEGSYDLDIEPDDIDMSDTVTVVWEIA